MAATMNIGTLPAQPWTTILDGKRLRQLRRQHGLSQEGLAERAGISVATVARLDLPALPVLPVPDPGPSCRSAWRESRHHSPRPCPPLTGRRKMGTKT